MFIHPFMFMSNPQRSIAGYPMLTQNTGSLSNLEIAQINCYKRAPSSLGWVTKDATKPSNDYSKGNTMLSNSFALLRLANIKQNLVMGQYPAAGYEPHHIQELIDYVVSTEIRDKDNATALRMAAEGMDKLKAELAKVQKWNDNQREIIEGLLNKPDEVWHEIVKLLTKLHGSNSWLDAGTSGLEAAKNTITNWATTAEKFEVLLESLDDALDEATSPDEVRSEDEPVLIFDEASPFVCDLDLGATGWIHYGPRNFRERI